MPAFDYDPNQPRRPFMHTNVAGDMTKQPYMASMAEQGPRGDADMRMLKMALKKRKMERGGMKKMEPKSGR